MKKNIFKFILLINFIFIFFVLPKIAQAALCPTNPPDAMPQIDCPNGCQKDYSITALSDANRPWVCVNTPPPTPAPADNGTLKLTMPVLQISIPGMAKFSEATKCSDDPTKLCVNWIGQYIAGIYKYAVGIVGILATVILMVGGVVWLMAGGDASRITEAKAWITAAITGLVIMLSSYMILYQINPDIINGVSQPLKLALVKELEEEVQYTSSGGGTGNITTNISTYDTLLKNDASSLGVDCTLLKATMYAESSGNPNAVSPKGAQGLIQLMPETASGICGSSCDMTDPATNLLTGTKYYRSLQTTACNGALSNSVCDATKLDYLIASYNGGPGANRASTLCPGQTWWQCSKNPKFQQTRDYVNKVKNNIQKLKDAGWGC